MKKFVFILMALVTFESQCWLQNSIAGENPKQSPDVPPDPLYNGKPLSEWLKVLFRWEYAHGRITNEESKEAVQQIGTNALPLLLNWIAKPESGWSASDQDRAVDGFEVLGPVAKPAVPDLIKIIGQNRDYPERALVFIGKDAVPALADKLVETFSDTNDPISYNWRIDVRHDSGFYIRERILGVLNQMGTNAEAALPALIQTITTNQPTEIRFGWLMQQNPYAVFVNVGRNHQDEVIPILLERFNNPDLSQFKRGQVADAISIFGTNQAKVFMPVLIAALSENKTNDSSRIQIGAAVAVIGNNQPDTLVPVFLTALTDKNNNEGRTNVA
jgi:hypothetical protein